MTIRRALIWFGVLVGLSFVPLFLLIVAANLKDQLVIKDVHTVAMVIMGCEFGLAPFVFGRLTRSTQRQQPTSRLARLEGIAWILGIEFLALLWLLGAAFTAFGSYLYNVLLDPSSTESIIFAVAGTGALFIFIALGALSVRAARESLSEQRSNASQS